MDLKLSAAPARGRKTGESTEGRHRLRNRLIRHYQLYLMLLPCIVFFLSFFFLYSDGRTDPGF